jgi:pimeloyl-ACP methyl ester carboxylesterase
MVIVDDVELHVRTLTHAERAAAARPTLVFLHDSLGSVALWRDFPERLARATGCDALVYDRRGYGRSAPFGSEPRTPAYLEDEARPLARLLAHFQIERAILFGHSDGGSIALIAAAFHPERIAGIITEGAHVFVEELTLAGIRDARVAFRTTDLPRRLARYHGDKTEAVAAAWIDTWLAPEFRDWNIERVLPRVHCPVLVLQGADDEYGTPAQVEAIARGVNGPAEPHLIPGVGHTPHKEAADEVLGLVTSFVKRLMS